MYKTIPIQYLDQWLEQGYNGRIIDLRSPSSYCQGHISGAENYPFDDLMDDPDLLDGSCHCCSTVQGDARACWSAICITGRDIRLSTWPMVSAFTGENT